MIMNCYRKKYYEVFRLVLNITFIFFIFGCGDKRDLSYISRVNEIPSSSTFTFGLKDVAQFDFNSENFVEGGTSFIYSIFSYASKLIDSSITGTMDAIEYFRLTEPVQTTKDRFYYWEPYQVQGANIKYQFSIMLKDENDFIFYLDAKNVSDFSQTFQNILEGSVSYSDGIKSGYLYIDLEELRKIDIENKLRGRMQLYYSDDGYTVSVTGFADFLYNIDVIAELYDDIEWTKEKDSKLSFKFKMKADVYSVEDQLPSLEEITGSIIYLNDGKGAGRLMISGGNIGDETSILRECWGRSDEGFVSFYRESNYESIFPQWGEMKDCGILPPDES